MSRNMNVQEIKFGGSHVYVRCEGDKHYLWGSNGYGECLFFDDDIHSVREPQLIEWKGKVIKDVFLGAHNTKIIGIEIV